ncbi:hypothetical protein [Pseudogracilibacillus sp. SO30301A]|uniref:hypothetical protein n=1 Tax=Pseudogracilibacillus sp. SO30301A TaxID=3098291 RepID=UPI00300DD91F
MEALLGVIIIMISVRILPYLVHKIAPNTLHQKNVKVNIFLEHSQNIENTLSEIQEFFEDIKHIKFSGVDLGHKLELECKLPKNAEKISTYYNRINSLAGVVSVEIESNQPRFRNINIKI